MKKKYQAPIMTAVNVNMKYHLLDGSVTTMGGNANIGYGGGGSGEAKSRGFDDWDEE